MSRTVERLEEELADQIDQLDHSTIEQDWRRAMDLLNDIQVTVAKIILENQRDC